MVRCLIYPEGVRVSERWPIESAYLCFLKKKIKNAGLAHLGEHPLDEVV